MMKMVNQVLKIAKAKRKKIIKMQLMPKTRRAKVMMMMLVVIEVKEF